MPTRSSVSRSNTRRPTSIRATSGSSTSCRSPRPTSSTAPRSRAWQGSAWERNNKNKRVFPGSGAGRSGALRPGSGLPHRPRAENRGADAHVGGAEGDGDLEVGAHAHRQQREPVAPGDLRGQREMRRRCVVERRNAHQAGDREAVTLAAGGDEAVGLLRLNAGFLGLGAGIDLDEQRRAALLPRHFLGERRGKAVAVERMDGVEQGDGVARLVGLQRPDQVQRDAVMARQQRRPFGLGLLHAVLAEHALARFDHRRDRLGVERFRNGNQGHAGRIAAGLAAGGVDVAAHGGEAGGPIHGFHRVNAPLRLLQIARNRQRAFLPMSARLRNRVEGRMADDGVRSSNKLDTGFRSTSRQPPRGGKPLLSIRARLIVLALLAVAPLMFERIHSIEEARGEHTARAHAQVIDLARRGAEAQHEIILSVRALLQIVARVYARTPLDAGDCNHYLASLAGNLPWIRTLSVADTDGRIRCSTGAQAIGLNVSDRPHFQHALQSREFALSDYVISRMNQPPTIIATLPAIKDDGAVAGVVLASIHLEWISELAASATERSGASVLLVDGGGTLTAASANLANAVGKRFADTALVRDMLAHDEGTLTTAGLDGVQRIFAYVRVPWTNARLAVGLDQEAVQAGINREIGIGYLQLALIGALVLMVVWFGGEHLIVRPIRSLVRTVARFGRGDLQVRAHEERWVAEFE